MRRALLDLDANLPFIDVAPMGAPLDPQMRTWRLGASVFSAFGTLAIVLAAIGLWSSVAFAVSRRTREFAVRLALGAQRRSLISSTVAVGLRDALVAVAAGLVLAAFGAAYGADLLYGVAPRDPVIFAAVAVSVLLIAAIASVLPAYRVSAIDPASSLRTD